MEVIRASTSCPHGINSSFMEINARLANLYISSVAKVREFEFGGEVFESIMGYVSVVKYYH